ncbi:MAG TPA: Crp/Fnr family transcriptional regulator [Pyrinomonadaceae bacterium]|jgi:CRP-like cAMP-binding protein
MFNKARNPKQSIANRLLAALPTAEYERLFPKLKQITLNYGENIYERGEIIRHVYFPDSGIISLLAAVEESALLEVGIIGNEGMVGLAVFLGVKKSNNRAVVQGEGLAMKMKAEDFLAECKNGEALPRLLHRYTHSLLTQVSQSAVCYRFHSIEARLARWLLMTSDRMRTNEFRLTQEFLSNMLGVRREAVNKSAVTLQQQQVISYSRGNVSIINRAELEKTSCPCYGIIKNEEKSFPVRKN